jgi:hypothetical protein
MSQPTTTGVSDWSSLLSLDPTQHLNNLGHNRQLMITPMTPTNGQSHHIFPLVHGHGGHHGVSNVQQTSPSPSHGHIHSPGHGSSLVTAAEQWANMLATAASGNPLAMNMNMSGFGQQHHTAHTTTVATATSPGGFQFNPAAAAAAAAAGNMQAATMMGMNMIPGLWPMAPMDSSVDAAPSSMYGDHQRFQQLLHQSNTHLHTTSPPTAHHNVQGFATSSLSSTTTHGHVDDSSSPASHHGMHHSRLWFTFVVECR